MQAAGKCHATDLPGESAGTQESEPASLLAELGFPPWQPPADSIKGRFRPRGPWVQPASLHF